MKPIYKILISFVILFTVIIIYIQNENGIEEYHYLYNGENENWKAVLEVDISIEETINNNRIGYTTEQVKYFVLEYKNSFDNRNLSS